MTTVAATTQKLVGYPLAGSKQIVQVRYDFAAEGGATNTFTLLKALEDLVITHWHAVVTTACTSGGSAVVTVGITGATTQFLGATNGAVANLTAGAVIGPDASVNVPCKLASGGFVQMAIATAALTAGVIDFTIEVMKV